jgi:hypothetical protein
MQELDRYGPSFLFLWHVDTIEMFVPISLLYNVGREASRWNVK